MPREIQLDRPTPTQERVIAALVQGATITAAAAHNHVDAATVHYWCRSHPAFQSALGRAREIHGENVREGLRLLSAQALDTLRNLLADPQTPPSIRLRAALSVIRETAQPEAAAPDPITEQAICEGLYSYIDRKNSFQRNSSLSTPPQL